MGRTSSFGAGMPEEEVLELTEEMAPPDWEGASAGRQPEAEEEQGGQEQGQKLGSFHGRIPFSDLDGYTYSGQRRIVDWICTPKGKFSYPEPRTPSRAAGSGTRMARPSRRIRPACSKS